MTQAAQGPRYKKLAADLADRTGAAIIFRGSGAGNNKKWGKFPNHLPLSSMYVYMQPSPTNVVSGPFRANPLRRIDSKSSSDRGFPAFSKDRIPASYLSYSNRTPVASSTRTVESMLSGPIPSPGMTVMVCAIFEVRNEGLNMDKPHPDAKMAGAP